MEQPTVIDAAQTFAPAGQLINVQRQGQHIRAEKASGLLDDGGR